MNKKQMLRLCASIGGEVESEAICSDIEVLLEDGVDKTVIETVTSALSDIKTALTEEAEDKVYRKTFYFYRRCI